MYSQTLKRLNQLSQNLLTPKQTQTPTTTQKLNKPCEVCKDTETGIPTGLVYWNDIGQSGIEKFSLHDCPSCKGEKIVYELW